MCVWRKTAASVLFLLAASPALGQTMAAQVTEGRAMYAACREFGALRLRAGVTQTIPLGEETSWKAVDPPENRVKIVDPAPDSPAGIIIGKVAPVCAVFNDAKARPPANNASWVAGQNLALKALSAGH